MTDELSYEFVRGAKIDYVDELIKAGFEVCGYPTNSDCHVNGKMSLPAWQAGPHAETMVAQGLTDMPGVSRWSRIQMPLEAVAVAAPSLPRCSIGSGKLGREASQAVILIRELRACATNI